MLIKFMSGFQSVGIIIILIAIGYIITSVGKSNETINKFISWFVITIAMPCNMLLNITKYFSAEEISSIHKAIMIPGVAMIIGLFIGAVIVKIFRLQKSRAGTVIVLTALNNTIFMGLPINQAFFGDGCTAFVLYYYLANTILFWTVGVFLISGQGIKKINWRKIISPPLIGVIIGIIIVAAGVELPKFVSSTLSHLGNMTTGLSMIFIGGALALAGVKNIRFDKELIIGCAVRFLIGPAISIALFKLVGIDGLMFKVFVVQSFMPVMANQVIVAKEYGADSFFASETVVVTTLISLIILPLVYICL